MKSIIQGAVLVFLVAGKSFSRGAQFWKKYVIAPFCLIEQIHSSLRPHCSRVKSNSKQKHAVKLGKQLCDWEGFH